MGRSNHSAKFKADLVIEAIKEEQHISEIAAGYGINPNLLRNWKKDFLENASAIFDKGREEKSLQEIKKQNEAEREELLRTIGQLTMERDWLEKKSIEVFGEGYEKKFGRRQR